MTVLYLTPLGAVNSDRSIDVAFEILRHSRFTGQQGPCKSFAFIHFIYDS